MKLLILSLILFLAAFFRFYQLDSYPPHLNWDEVSIGYNSYSVLKTGKDEWGQFLPLSFRAYGDYKLPGYIYLDTPFIAIFGLNEWAVRLPSALAGFGVVVLIYLITRKLVKNETVALLATLLAGLTPWLIILSRIALEANLALFLLTLSFYLLLLSFEKKWILVLASTSLSLAVFTYNSARVVATPYLMLVILIFGKKLLKDKKFTFPSAIILLITFLTVFPLAILQDSSARYKWTTILDEGAINKINELRGSSALPPLAEKLVYNKASYFIPVALKSYISHFDPNFLYLNGGSNYQFSVPGSGLFLIISIPLFLFGLWKIFKEKEKWPLFIFGWLLISPIPAAITRDSPHALRALFLAIPYLLICGLGTQLLFEKMKKKYIWSLVGIINLLIFAETILFWQNYTGEYVKNYSWSWQYGYKEAIEYVEAHNSEYDQVIFTKKYGEPHEFLLFYAKYDPLSYREDPNLVRYNQSDWWWVGGFSKYKFVNDWEIIERVKSQESRVKSMVVTSPGNYQEGGHKLETINFLNGDPAFDIVEYR